MQEWSGNEVGKIGKDYSFILHLLCAELCTYIILGIGGKTVNNTDKVQAVRPHPRGRINNKQVDKHINNYGWWRVMKKIQQGDRVATLEWVVKEVKLRRLHLSWDLNDKKSLSQETPRRGKAGGKEQIPEGPIGQAKLSYNNEKLFEALVSWASALSMETQDISVLLKPKDPFEGRTVRRHCSPLS